VLTRPNGLARLLALVALGPVGVASAAPPARAPDGKAESAAPSTAAARAIAEPVRLTAGSSSDLMGVLGADEKSLYFVSDASGTLDIMLQAPVQSGPVTLSGGLGDAAWPQIAPDGKHIAYISFESDSTGDACVRDISGRTAGKANCLTNADSAELMVLWWDDKSLAVLSRPGLHGDFQLLRMPIDGGAPRTLLARNMVGVALSPDRHWLAYIPVNKAARDVGINFAQRAAVGVGLQRLGADSEPELYVPRLPGVTGSVAFSPRGDYLQFTQFLNDTNRDGAIDGNDNAVLFRVPFRGGARSPLSTDDEPEQLTSARWDCHYPAPGKHQLIASCSHEGSLDVYSLPLEGAVPHGWDVARLIGEAAVARDLWTRLLLQARRLALAPSPAAKEPVLLEMIGLHLALGEYEAAIYYAENRLVSEEARRFGHVIAELARHRRVDLALIRGETSAQYIESERARAQALRDGLPEAAPGLAQLSLLVISEIEDDIGDKTAALATFERLELAHLEQPLACALAAGRAERLYRLRGDREHLLEVYRLLSTLPVLDTAQRLEYAERFVRELARGRARAAQAAALAAAQAQVDPASELGLLLAVEKVLATLDDATEEAVRAQIFELYKQNKDVDRRRALVLSTLQAGARAGNEFVQYQFVTSWASSLARSHPERKYAEALYADIVLDRAYGEGRQHRRDESRGYFYGATLATDSLEAHIGFIEARIAEGGPKVQENIDEVYEQRFARAPDSPEYAFVKAYRIARELPRERDPERHERSVSRVVELLARVADELPKQSQVHQLWGFALHQRARRNGSREAAVAANRQYLLALDLARDDERLTATLLHRLGLLQASLGNHGAALRYLRRRDELPHVRPDEELGLRVAIARSAWHSGDAALAKQQMLAATGLVRKTPALARYEVLIVDRLGLSLAAAGDASAARDRYAELDGLLSRDPTASPINQVKAKVGLSANALESGQAAKSLGSLDEAERILDRSDALDPKPDVVWRRSLIGDFRYTPLQYRALVAGLRAGAERALTDHPAALQATALRVELLEKRLRESGVDEDRLELAQAYHHLAMRHDTLADPVAAARAVEKGLALSDQYNENTGSEINDAELALIRDYAELHLYRAVPLEALRRNLKAELRRAYSVICKYRSPRWSMQRYLFKTYLTELAMNERL
jgi:cellulose synthase operon protein C